MRANQTRISANQVFWMMLITQIVTIALLSFRTTIAIAKQDAWISMLIGGLIGLVMSFCIVQAGLQHSDKTIIASLQHLIGKLATGVIIFPYFVISLTVVGLNMKEFMTFVHLALFSGTPQWVLVVLFTSVIAYLTMQGGIEGVGRCAQIIGPCVVATVAFVTLMNMDFLDIHQIMPIYFDSGVKRILSGSFVSAFLFAQTFVLFMLIPFVNKPEHVKPAAIWAVVFAIAFMSIQILAELMLFGPHLSAAMLNPTFEYARFISSMNFIENVDSIIVVFWIAGYFVMFSMYLFAISYGMSQWLNLKRWNISIVVCAFVVVTVALIPIKFHIADMAIHYMGWFIALIIVHLLIVPLAFWFIGQKRHEYAS